MADQIPASETRPDPLTPAERFVLAGMALLTLSWAFNDRRGEQAILLAGYAPLLRRDRDFDALALVLGQMRAADTHQEWSFAAAAAERAVVPILRRDMLAALRHLPEKG